MTLTVADARALVGVRASDSSRDERLQQLIDAAYEQAVYFVGPLEPSTVTETACNRRGQLLLAQPPVTELISVAGVADPSTLRVYRRSGLVEGLPRSCTEGDVLVTYTSGYVTVPASVEEGVRAWVKHRGLQEALGSDSYGSDDIETAVTDFSGLPNAVRNAWRPYLLDKGAAFA